MIGYFEEEAGVKSINRVNTSLLVYVGLLIAVATVFIPPFTGVVFNVGENFTFAISLIGAGLAGKVISKFAE